MRRLPTHFLEHTLLAPTPNPVGKSIALLYKVQGEGTGVRSGSRGERRPVSNAGLGKYLANI